MTGKRTLSPPEPKTGGPPLLLSYPMTGLEGGDELTQPKTGAVPGGSFSCHKTIKRGTCPELRAPAIASNY